MAMSLDQSLEKIYEEIVPKKEIRKLDVILIAEHIIDLMKEKDSLFKELCRTITRGNISESVKVQLPNDFDFYMILNPSFPITPREDSFPPGSINLYTRSGIVHPMVHHNRYCRQCLQDWIRKILTEIMLGRRYIEVNSEVKYFIYYDKYDRGYIWSHTIDVCKDGCLYVRINFAPVLEFDSSLWPLDNEHKLSDQPWLALPFCKKIEMGSKFRPDEYSFMASQYRWMEKDFDVKPNLKKSLFLLRVMGDDALFIVTSCVVKTVYQWEVESRSDEYWDKPINEILIEMLGILIRALRDEDLPFFFHKNFDEPDGVHRERVKITWTKLLSILEKLRFLKNQGNVKNEDVKVLFGRRY